MRHRIESDLETRTKYEVMRRGELDQTVGFLLRAAWKELSRTFTFFFREYDFTPALYAIMILVELNPGCGAGDLAKPMGISQNNLVHLVDELVERGLLTKTTHSKDKRVKVLELTGKGMATLAQLRRAHKLYEKQALQALSTKDLKDLKRILVRFESSAASL
jgi:DNA-binding MarR family transcriptional regulator